MNTKKKTIFLILIFVAVMIATSVLYRNLSSTYSSNNLISNSSVENNPTSDITADDNSNSTPSEDTASQAELTKAPDFTVFDEDGNEVTLSSYFGKPIILNFWASWCGPCKSEMPDFDQAFSTYGNDIEFLMINLTDGSRETVESATSFINEQGYSFPILFDSEYSASITYSVSSIPTTYFIDSEGNLVAQAQGAIDSSILQQGIDMIVQN